MKLSKSQLKRIIKEEISKALSEDVPQLDMEEIFAVTRAASDDDLDAFEGALVGAIKKLVPSVSPQALSQIIRNIGEHKTNLQRAIDTSYSVAGAGREFINDIAAMAARF